MRGWTPIRPLLLVLRAGCPAYAGMDPHQLRISAHGIRLPRVCGDGPLRAPRCGFPSRAAPRMRGWTRSSPTRRPPPAGCPAYAGMDPGGSRRRSRSWRLPRVCGDGPAVFSAPDCNPSAAPRMRGWTPDAGGDPRRARGCPAYAGMDPSQRRIVVKAMRLPRVCGDGPHACPHKSMRPLAAPRMRGWTHRLRRRPRRQAGCPAYAGMDPWRLSGRRWCRWLPRVCGVASGWSVRRVGFTPTGKRRLFTAHILSGPSILRRERRQCVSARRTHLARVLSESDDGVHQRRWWTPWQVASAKRVGCTACS